MSSSRVRCVFAITFAVVLAAGVAWADDPEVERVVDQWSKRPAIESGRVKGLHLDLSSHTPDELIRGIGEKLTAKKEGQADAALKGSLSPEEFGKLFDEVFLDLAAAPDPFAAMQRNLDNWMAKTGRKYGQQVDYTCSRLTVVKDGSDLKNDQQYLENRSIRSTRGKRTAWYMASEKMGGIAVDDKPAAGTEEDPVPLQSWTFPIETLRHWVPSDPESLKHFKLMKLVKSENGKESRLVGPQGEITFDTASGFVLTATNGAEGPFSAEVRYARPKRVTGDVELATVYAHVQYMKTKAGESRLTTADVFIVESAEINVKIAPEEFAVPVPKGTLIRDTGDLFVQLPRRTIREFRAKDDVPDLMTVVFPKGR